MDREVARVHAKNKQEAIAALEHLIKTIKSSEYDGEVSEYVIVVNEGNVANKRKKREAMRNCHSLFLLIFKKGEIYEVSRVCSCKEFS